MGLFSSKKKTRYAVVGVGWFAQAAVLPGFANADNAELVAIVSGDDDKRDDVGKLYGCETYTYEQYDSLLASGKIDAVYLVLPNAMHKEYTVRAAKHKVHVLCEKPMAADAAEAREMIAACEANGVYLMIAYRLHLEQANLAAIDTVQSGKIGEPRLIQLSNAQNVVDNSTRLDGDLAGGPLMDLGVYCINAARYLYRDDPTEVTAFTVHGTDPKFAEVPESVAAVLRFPGEKLAVFSCGFNHGKASEFRVLGTTGSVGLDPAFSFRGEKVLEVLSGTSAESAKPKETTYSDTDHVGAELVYFAKCIQDQTPPEPDGYEGLADMLIIDAIKESSKTGRSVKVGPFKDKKRPSSDMVYKLPQVKQPKLIHAQAPTGES